MTRKFRTIFSNHPNARDLADMAEVERERIEEAKTAAAEVVFEGFASMVAVRELGETELISDILLHRNCVDKQIEAISERNISGSKIPGGRLVKHLVTVKYVGDKHTQIVGTRLRLNGRLVGERIRTEASSKLFSRRRDRGEDLKAPAANRFLANWVDPKVRYHAKRMGMAPRRIDRMHADALHMQDAFGGDYKVVVNEVINDPAVLEDLIDATAAAPKRAKEMMKEVSTYSYNVKRGVAAALGLGGNGKADELDAKIRSTLQIAANGVISPQRAEAIAEAKKVVVTRVGV